MTRGRKKDHTLPESRTLSAQRSYRDRKAKYVADLERRCAVAEAEVVRLREELAEARRIQGDTSILATQEAHQLLRGCSDMIAHLSSTQQALVHFQERLRRTERVNQSHSPSSPITQPSNLDLLITAMLSQTQHPGPAIEDFTRAVESSNSMTGSDDSHGVGGTDVRSESGSECCGGFIDCSQFPSENTIT